MFKRVFPWFLFDCNQKDNGFPCLFRADVSGRGANLFQALAARDEARFTFSSLGSHVSDQTKIRGASHPCEPGSQGTGNLGRCHGFGSLCSAADWVPRIPDSGLAFGGLGADD